MYEPPGSPLRSKSRNSQSSREGRSILRSLSPKESKPNGILRHKSPSANSSMIYQGRPKPMNSDLELSPVRPQPPVPIRDIAPPLEIVHEIVPIHETVLLRETSPLRSKSPKAPLPNIDLIEPKHTSNKELRQSYYRQINLTKKGTLNYYETSLFVGYLLDLINLSKKLENLKHRLIQNQEEFNLLDAFAVLVSTVEYDKYNQGYENFRLSNIDFREALMDLGMRADRVSMDKVFLFFRRWNLHKDERMTFREFAEALGPINQKMAYRLHTRAVRNQAVKAEYLFGKPMTEAFLKVMECVLETEVEMEKIRQKLKERKDFDIGKAFLTLAQS